MKSPRESVAKDCKPQPKVFRFPDPALSSPVFRFCLCSGVFYRLTPVACRLAFTIHDLRFTDLVLSSPAFRFCLGSGVFCRLAFPIHDSRFTIHGPCPSCLPSPVALPFRFTIHDLRFTVSAPVPSSSRPSGNPRPARHQEPSHLRWPPVGSTRGTPA